MTSEETLNWYRENRCKEPGCKNLSEQGIIYCINHYHGFPRRIPDDILAELEKVKV